MKVINVSLFFVTNEGCVMVKVTLKQIAEQAGVSINTVSLALRGMRGRESAALPQNWGIMRRKATVHHRRNCV